MSIQEYLGKIKKLQVDILNFIDDEDNSEEKFENLKLFIVDIKIRENKHDIKLLLRLLIKKSNNYHRTPDFFNKIEKILQMLKNEIKNYFTNQTIFNIFKSNKRILLFLINEEIISIDKNIFSIITNDKYSTSKYPQYFYFELKNFLKENNGENYIFHDENHIEKIENFKEKQKIGENCNNIVKLIQNDLVDEFKKYVKEKSIDLKSSIEASIFETNPFLIKQKETTLIEYTAFFGSIQIFEYLALNKVELTPSLWLHAVHSNSLKMIHLLEEYNVKPEGKSYIECFVESIKCHHIDVSYYLQNYYLPNESNVNIYSDVQGDNAIFIHAFPTCLKYYNFNFLLIGFPNYITFFYLCKYDYYNLVELLSNIIFSNINNIIVFLTKLFYTILV